MVTLPSTVKYFSSRYGLGIKLADLYFATARGIVRLERKRAVEPRSNPHPLLRRPGAQIPGLAASTQKL